MFPWLHAVRHEEQKIWKGYFIYPYLRSLVLFLLSNLSFIACLSGKLWPFPCAWFPPLGTLVDLHLPEVQLLLLPSIQLFPFIQHFYLVWLFFSPLLVLCVCHFPFLYVCCVLTLTISKTTASRYYTGVQPKPERIKKHPGKGWLGTDGLPHLYFFISGL